MNDIISFIDEFPQGFIALEEALDYLPEHYSQVATVGRLKVFQDARIPSLHLQGNGCELLILGHFGTVAPEENENWLLARAESDGLQGFLSSLHYAVGRWAIIARFKDDIFVVNDAIGSRTTYYSLQVPAVSSHVGLLRRAIPHHQDCEVFSVTQSYALDLTEVEEIRALLPNFVLNLYDREVERFYPVSTNPYCEMSIADLVDQIEHLWKLGLKWARELDYRHAAALTSGFDSRLNAALMPNPDDVTFYTYRQAGLDDSAGYSAQTWNRDAAVGRHIASLKGFRYSLLEFGDISTISPQDLTRLAANAPLRHGEAIVPEYWKAFGKLETIIHRSTAHEIGIDYYASDSFTGSKVGEAARLCENEFSKGPNMDSRSESVNQLVERYVKQMGLERAAQLGYGPVGVYFWEQRQGRFHAEVQLGMDAVVVPLNGFASRALWDSVFSLPAPIRRTRWYEYLLIARNAPELNGIPLNGTDTLMQAIQGERAKNRGLPLMDPSVVDADVRLYRGSRAGRLGELDSSRPWILYLDTPLIQGHWSEALHVFNQAQGSLRIDFRNPYGIGRRSGCLEIQLRVNDDVVVREDIGFTGDPIQASLYGLQRGDRVSLRIVCLKDLPASWRGASRTELLGWNCGTDKAGFNPELRIGWSSPWREQEEEPHGSTE